MSNDLQNIGSWYILKALEKGMDNETKIFILVMIIAAILGIVFGVFIDIDWGNIFSF